MLDVNDDNISIVVPLILSVTQKQEFSRNRDFRVDQTWVVFGLLFLRPITRFKNNFIIFP